MLLITDCYYISSKVIIVRRLYNEVEIKGSILINVNLTQCRIPKSSIVEK